MGINRAHYILLFLLLVLLPVGVFFPAIGYGFVWDDEFCHLHHNIHLKNLSWDNLKQLWQSPHQGMYIPLTYTFWAGIKYFQGTDVDFVPEVFHGANLVFHIANGILVFLLLHSIVKSKGGACVGALLFLLHPLQVESVAWISEFRGILSAFFSFFALWQYRIYSQRQQREKPWAMYYCIATLAFVCSVLAKPSAVVLPLIAAVLDFFVEKRSGKKVIQSLWLWGGIALAIALVTKMVQPDQSLNFLPPVILRPFIAADALSFYLLKLIVPYPLCALYGRTPELVVQSGVLFWSWIPGALLIVSAWHYRSRFPLFPVAVAIFILGFLSVSGIIPFIFQNHSTVADRYLYLSLLGPALFLASLFSRPSVFLAKKTLFLILLIGVWTAISFGRLSVWENKITLWQDVIEHNPKLSVAHNNLGCALEKKGEVDQAISHYHESLKIDPYYAQAHNNLGNALKTQERTAEATWHYKRALELDPGLVEAYNNLGGIFSEMGNTEEALEHYSQAAQINPQSAVVFNNLGNILQKQHNIDEAVKYFQQALKMDPYFAPAHYNLANFLMKKGDTQAAMKHYREAIRVQPNYMEAHNNLGKALVEEGKIEEGILYYKKALSFDPNSAVVYYNLGKAFTRKGDRKQEIDSYRQAIAAQPDFILAHYNLAHALLAEKDILNAQKHYQKILKINPSHTGARVNIGSIYEQEGNLTVAIEHYQAAVEKDPSSAIAHYNLGNVLFQKENFSKAIFHYSQAIQEKPNFAEAHLNLGNAFFQQNQMKEAEKSYQNALHLASESSLIHYSLAKVYEKIGPRDQAIYHYREVLRLDPNNSAVSEILERILKKNK